jgi:hypothetical protein
VQLFLLAGCASAPPVPRPIPTVTIPAIAQSPPSTAGADRRQLVEPVSWDRAMTVHELMEALSRSRRVALVVDHADSRLMPALLAWWGERRAPSEFRFVSFDGSGSPAFSTQALILSLGGSYAEGGRFVEVPLCAILEAPFPPSRDLSESVITLFQGLDGCTSEIYNWLYLHQRPR